MSGHDSDFFYSIYELIEFKAIHRMFFLTAFKQKLKSVLGLNKY